MIYYAVCQACGLVFKAQPKNKVHTCPHCGDDPENGYGRHGAFELNKNGEIVIQKKINPE